MRLKLPKGWKAKGVFVGKCIDGWERSFFSTRAHAHVTGHDPNFGWICVFSLEDVGSYTFNPIENGGEITTPSNLLKHEETHFYVPDHSSLFVQKMEELWGKVWEPENLSLKKKTNKPTKKNKETR